MSSLDDVDAILGELLSGSDNKEVKKDDTEEPILEGTFQSLSSLGGYLGVYQDLANPTKAELIEALYAREVRNAADEWVYDFVQVDEDLTRGFIRSKSGDWIEHQISDTSTTTVSGKYGDLTKLASFFGLYDKYGLDRPSADKLKHALATFGVEDSQTAPNQYTVSLESDDGEEYLIGVQLDDITTAYPVDSNGNRIGNEEYTKELLPRLRERLESGQLSDLKDAEQFAPPLPDEVKNLLENETVSQNYQLIMHRLAEQAAGDDVPKVIRKKKLAEARFITEVLSGQRTWE